MKKALAIVATIVTLFTALCLQTQAVAIYEGDCGQNIIWVYDEETKTLTLSGSGYMDNYTGEIDYTIGAPRLDVNFNCAKALIFPYWKKTELPPGEFRDDLDIRRLVVGEGIKSIGCSAFENEEIEEVILPESLEIIGDRAFLNCKNIKEIKLPENLIGIGKRAFEGCESLVKVNLPDKDFIIGAAKDDFDSKREIYIGHYAFFETPYIKAQTEEKYIPLQKSDKGIIHPRSKYEDDYIGPCESTLWYEKEIYSEDSIVDGVCGANLTWHYENNTLTISGTGDMTDYHYYPFSVPKWLEDHYPARWSQWRESMQNLVIENIIVEDGVTSIGTWAFSGINGRRLAIYIPDSVKEIPPYAFKICNRVFVVRMPQHLLEKKDEIFADHTNMMIEDTDRWVIVTSDDEEFESIKNSVAIMRETPLSIAKYSLGAGYIKNDRTMVPMRAIFESLGADVSWDDSTKTAIGVKDGVEVKITIGENVLYKNGEAIELDAPAEITNDRTMVPVRAISEAFGCTVEWDNETKTVEITS
ncbi:MAG: leucine-rich repeat protein [Clostridia bacterium]|nr:leucine-rich repeat protein [Clostridia bacterium]